MLTEHRHTYQRVLIPALLILTFPALASAPARRAASTQLESIRTFADLSERARQRYSSWDGVRIPPIREKP